MRSSLVLAGGRGKRLGYVEKALIPFMDSTIIQHIIELLGRVADEIIISVRDEEQRRVLEDYTGGLPIVVDRFYDVGPLAGILEGLNAASGEYVFVSACDMPYLNTEVVELLLDRAAGHDAAIPLREDQVLEPLHAVYRTAPMADETMRAITRNDNIVLAPVFRLRDVEYVKMEEIRRLDPQLKTFVNINTPDDLGLLKVA